MRGADLHFNDALTIHGSSLGVEQTVRQADLALIVAASFLERLSPVQQTWQTTADLAICVSMRADRA